MNFTDKINALIWEIEHELGVDRGFPITLELAKASLAARRLEALDAPACGIDCEGFHGCARGYESTDACFETGRKWPNENTRKAEPMERVAEFLEARV